MNVLFLTRTDTMKLTGGIWFRQCRCFFNHKKNTDPFVIVGSSFFFTLKVGVHENKKPWCTKEQNLLSCYWLRLVPSNYLLLLLWENKILLYRSLVLTKSSSLFKQLHAEAVHSLFFWLCRSLPQSKYHKFESMTNFKFNQNTSHTHSPTDSTHISAAIAALKVFKSILSKARQLFGIQ